MKILVSKNEKNVFSTRYAFFIFNLQVLCILIKLQIVLKNDRRCCASGLPTGYYQGKFQVIFMRSDLFIYYLLTESEVITGKSQTSTLMSALMY